MEVVDAIAAMPNAATPNMPPTEPVAMTDVTVSEPLIHQPYRRSTPMTRATIATEIGDIEIELYDESAPKAAKNFIDLAKKGFYDDVIFHRVIPGFVIQGGDGQYGKKSALERGRVGTGGPGYKFEDEPVTGEYQRGSLAMANAGPNTNGSQFFICTADLAGKLPKNYTLFGQVTRGLDIVDKIVSAPRDGKDLPNDPVAMTKVTVHEDAAAQ